MAFWRHRSVSGNGCEDQVVGCIIKASHISDVELEGVRIFKIDRGVRSKTVVSTQVFQA